MDERTRPGLLKRLGPTRGRASRRGDTDGGDAPGPDGPEAPTTGSVGAQPAAPLGDAATPSVETEATTGRDRAATAVANDTGGGNGANASAAKPADETPASTRARPRPRRLRPYSTVADPAPLGLAALALTTLVFSLFSSDLLPEAGQPVVFGLAFAYGGLAQLLAGMWAFRTPNTFAATAFASFGAFWLSFALLEAFFADEIPAADLEVYLGWTLIAWALLTTGLYVASVRLTGRVNVVFGLLAATLYLVGGGQAAGIEIVTQVGGYLGIVTALVAGYAAFATIADETFAQRVLPVREPE